MIPNKIHFRFLFYFCTSLLFSTNLTAATPLVNETKEIAVEKISIKDIETQQGRKLKMKEKMAIRLINRSLKKVDKKGIKIDLVDSTTVSGYYSKIKNDKIYISEYVNLWNLKEDNKFEQGERIAIPFDQIRKIELIQKNKVIKKNITKLSKGIVLLLASVISLIIAVYIGFHPVDPNADTVDFSGCLITISANLGLFLLSGGIYLIANSPEIIVPIHSETFVLNGAITDAQIFAIKAFFK